MDWRGQVVARGQCSLPCHIAGRQVAWWTDGSVCKPGQLAEDLQTGSSVQPAGPRPAMPRIHRTEVAKIVGLRVRRVEARVHFIVDQREPFQLNLSSRRSKQESPAKTRKAGCGLSHIRQTSVLRLASTSARKMRKLQAPLRKSFNWRRAPCAQPSNRMNAQQAWGVA